MSKKTAMTPLITGPKEKLRDDIPALKRSKKRERQLVIWFGLMLIIGLVLVGVVSSMAGAWVKNVKLPISGQVAAPTPRITVLKVQRTAPYAGLDMTILSVQYADYFTDDTVHAGAGVVRLNLHVVNATRQQINVVYYEIARLLAPGLAPIAPTNVHLSVGPAPGSSENGWLDFSVVKKVTLTTLTLELGSTTLNEALVKLPFTGPFNTSIYTNHSSKQTLLIAYNFFGHILNYHLTSVEERFSYQGVQCKAGQQFYVFNFLVDNPEGNDTSPGYGFDYIRLVLNGTDRPPVNNSLPSIFKASSTNTGGHVVFAAPAGLKSLTVGFLSQNGNGEQDYAINL